MAGPYWKTAIFIKDGRRARPSLLTLPGTVGNTEWELESSKNSRITRAHPSPAATRPTIKGLAKIDAHRVTGGDLVLEFEKVFLRAPELDRGEGDFTFSVQDLRDYYDDVWTAAF
ncbi:hypothetical protein HOY82DRAFT_610566 [Tuber indicum]|nr:hypothetical protein HOY82DRAFT_610566 [Tuber indicum]